MKYFFTSYEIFTISERNMFKIKSQILNRHTREIGKCTLIESECVKKVSEFLTVPKMHLRSASSKKEEEEQLYIVDIKGNGDCFYAAIVKAFKRSRKDVKDLLANLAEVKIYIYAIARL